jgi:hypothetical protein
MQKFPYPRQNITQPRAIKRQSHFTLVSTFVLSLGRDWMSLTDPPRQHASADVVGLTFDRDTSLLAANITGQWTLAKLSSKSTAERTLSCATFDVSEVDLMLGHSCSILFFAFN